MANTGRFIAYYRVSTRQGRSGFGLDTQRETVHNYLNGGDWQLVGEFTEVESGKRADRPEFAKALAACRLHCATLVIARLDRLSRNLHFVSSLMESGVEFVAIDFPLTNELAIHIVAAVAEHEAEMISARTKAALAAAKKRGKKLGGFRGKVPTAGDRKRSAETLKQRAAARVADLKPVIEELQAAGATSLRAIAEALNERGIPTARREGVWQATQVARVIVRTRADALKPLFEELEGKSVREIARILNDRSADDPNLATPTGKPWSAVTVIRAQKRLAA